MIDTKNALLIAGVLFVAAIVGLYIPYVQYQKSQNAANIESATSTPAGPHVTIHYTNKGFEPNTLTVRVGTTVEWDDVSDKLMWVASDPHPAHTDLPGFDERGVASPESSAAPLQEFVPTAFAHAGGGIYTYTFIRVGTWTYHNHLVPSDRGVVIVE